MTKVGKAFNDSLSFSLKKCVPTFLVLLLCSIVFLFFKTLSFHAHAWVSFSFFFFPLMIGAFLLSALGIFLIDLYFHEKKGIKLTLKELVPHFLEKLLRTTYLTLFPILIFFILWIVLGFFLLIKEAPIFGSFIGAFLSFIPFLLVFSSVLLLCYDLFVLFFILPSLDLKKKGEVWFKETFLLFKAKPFEHLNLVFIALIPFIITLLLIAFSLNLMTLFEESSSNILLQIIGQFFVYLPICLLLTPSVIFFFQFSFQAHKLLHE